MVGSSEWSCITTSPAARGSRPPCEPPAPPLPTRRTSRAPKRIPPVLPGPAAGRREWQTWPVMLYDCRTVAERDWGIRAAIEAIARGDLVVLPTDTVYGIAADAFKPWAVTALLNAKGRGRHMPPPVLVGSRQTLDGLVFQLPKEARDLVDAFWPGALTIVVEQ